MGIGGYFSRDRTRDTEHIAAVVIRQDEQEVRRLGPGDELGAWSDGFASYATCATRGRHFNGSSTHTAGTT